MAWVTFEDYFLSPFDLTILTIPRCLSRIVSYTIDLINRSEELPCPSTGASKRLIRVVEKRMMIALGSSGKVLKRLEQCEDRHEYKLLQKFWLHLDGFFF